MKLIDKNDKKKIWIYNSGIEHDWQNKKCGVRKVNNRNEQKILNRQAELLFFIAKAEDTVFVVNESDTEFIEDMKKFGITKPKTVVIPDFDQPISNIIFENKEILQELKRKYDDNKTLYVSYILSKTDEEIAKYCGFELYGSTSDLIQKLNHKANARRIVKELGLPYIEGAICKSKEELELEFEHLKAKGFSEFVLKEPFNSAGKGVFFIRDEKQFHNFLKMMRFGNEQEEFEVIIEGWITGKRDINYQIEITRDGEIQMIAITEQIISVTAYKGSVYPPALSNNQMEYYKECVQVIGKKLYHMGFYGVVGIDSIIDRNGTIYPAIEFNARFNQSTFYIPFLQYFKGAHRRILIRSYDVKTKECIDYKGVKRFLEQKGVLYQEASKKGIIILNSSCLSMYQDETGNYESRLYFAYIYEENENDTMYYEKMDTLVKLLK